MAPTGWPDDWQQRKAGHNCELCSSIGGGDDERTLHVARLPYSEVRLERRSRLPGYCIVAWRLGHVVEPTELDREAAAGYWYDVLATARAVEAEFQPVKMNLLTLGNGVPHLHTHVVPRHADDPAAGGPIEWSAMFRDKPVDPDVLRTQVDAIRRTLS
jgi:diadenosine tetraphosphate (Ap4A) HIT family hydrolase